MHTSRRNFLKTTGCLTIGFSLGAPSFSMYLPQEELPQSLKRNPNINAWLQVLPDGKIKVFTGKLELGQGIRIAMAQMAAEELDMEPSMVEVSLAETGITPDEGYTAGSGSIDNSAMSVRYASAAARKKLLDLAAVKLNVPAEQLVLANARIAAPSGKTISFAELLAGKQITDKVTQPVTLKSKDKYRFVGKSILRQDITDMVRASPVYVQDLRFQGMVHARIVRPPVYGARLISYNENEVRSKVPAFLKLVVNGSFMGVVAKDEFSAIQCQRILKNSSKWSEPQNIAPAAHTELSKFLKSLPSKQDSLKEKGKVNLNEETGYTIHKAEYFKPYIMHGSIGPSCSVAFYDQQMLHIWSHSQGVYPLQTTIQNMTGLPLEQIHIKGVPGSGCYGHNGADDVAGDAALLAIAFPGKHIRVQWSREEEHGWEPYGSAMIMALEARMDGNGKISDWKHTLWSDTHGARPAGNANSLLPAHYLEKPFTGRSNGFSGGAYRNSEPYYSFPNQKVDVHFFEGPLRVSALRSLGAYANIFAIECFMDELAEKAKKDPFEFRLMHLDDPRAKAVVSRLRELIKGGEKQGSSIGIGFSRYKNTASYCAVAARLRITDSKSVQVEKMWAVIDPGEVINPDGIINQTEGGMIQAASWTLQEEVKFDTQKVTSLNWDAYPIFRFNQVPETEVVLIDNPAEGPMGAGEAAQGPAGAAIVNAVSKALGKRVRELPVLPLKN
jgi:nicotinate dehydrogenase subunit B